MNSRGPRTEPRGTLVVTGEGCEGVELNELSLVGKVRVKPLKRGGMETARNQQPSRGR